MAVPARPTTGPDLTPAPGLSPTLPQGPTPPGAAGGMGRPAPPSGAKPSAPTGAMAAVSKVPKQPESQFGTSSYLPTLDTSPLEMPDTHVTAEWCLEQMSRVLIEIAEEQDDPVWLESHRTLAEQWMGAAQLLLEHAREAKGITGDIELKQQQLYQQHELHQQSLSQNDQQHVQGINQKDDLHKQSMKQNDAQHAKDLKQTDVVNAQKMKQGDDIHKTNLSMQKDKQTHQQQMMRTQAQKARAKPTPGK